jgi:hypothetical protein
MGKAMIELLVLRQNLCGECGREGVWLGAFGARFSPPSSGLTA